MAAIENLSGKVSSVACGGRGTERTACTVASPPQITRTSQEAEMVRVIDSSCPYAIMDVVALTPG